MSDVSYPAGGQGVHGSRPLAALQGVLGVARPCSHRSRPPCRPASLQACAGGLLLAGAAATCAVCALGTILLVSAWGIGWLLFCLLCALTIGGAVAGTLALCMCAGAAILGLCVLSGGHGEWALPHAAVRVPVQLCALPV